MIRAGCYYKRQTYLEKCFEKCKNIKNKSVKKVIDELIELWSKRTKHGANKQKFGKYHENLLDLIVKYYLPPNEAPNKKSPLVIDKKFCTYCKAIAWNCQKNIGKKITKERTIRNGLVSLSEYDFLNSIK
jgi:hypothetical protein